MKSSKVRPLQVTASGSGGTVGDIGGELVVVWSGAVVAVIFDSSVGGSEEVRLSSGTSNMSPRATEEEIKTFKQCSILTMSGSLSINKTLKE